MALTVLSTSLYPRSSLIRAEIEVAVRESGAEAIVLGFAGMADLAKRLSVDFGLAVIDGVAAMVKQVEGLLAQGPKTSKMGDYAMPPRKRLCWSIC